ncbi:MAG: protease family protein [Gaiellales bacterium]|nr:protease family protein [Gaiellales bacterium]
MTPPVATDPRLQVPATDMLIVGGVALVATAFAGVAHSVLVSGNRDFIYSPGAMAIVIVTYLAMGAAALWAARRTGDARRALGLVAPRSWPRALGLALGTVLAALIVSALLEPIFHGADAQGVVPDSGRPPGFWPIAGVVLAYVAVALVGPLVEELIFRGLLTAALRRRFGPWRTAVVTAAFFAVAHFIPRVMPAVFLLGLALALVYERIGSTIPGMVVHCLYNGIALTAAVTTH